MLIIPRVHVQLVALVQIMGVPSTYGLFPPHNFFKTPIEIAVSVETLIQIEDNHLFHSHAFHSPTSKVVLPQSEPKSLLPPGMSLPRANYDPRRVCLNPFPEVSLGRHKRTIGIYLAGALVSPFLVAWSQSAVLTRLSQFALANWTFLDAAILSAHARAPWGENEPPPVHVTFVDWVPGICSLLGYIIINMIDKDRVRGDIGFGDSRAVWRARLILFIGFAFMAGGLAGSMVRSPDRSLPSS